MYRGVKFDLNDALQHPGRKVEFPIRTELTEEEDLDLLSPIQGALHVVSTGNLLLLKGRFETRLVVECARCAGPLEVDHIFSMEEQVPVEGIPSSYGADDFARIASDEKELFEGNHLLVDPFIRQGLMVSLPVQPLCTYGWDGDCPLARERGVNLDRPEPGHPAFAELRDILDIEGTDDKNS